MNIRKIAEHANVSVATVSRVLNNNGYVSPGTRKKVEEAIQRFNYTPSALARNFRMSTSHTILILLAELSNMFYIEVLKGVSEIARENGYDVLVCETNASSARQGEFLKKLENRFSDGAIVLDAPLQGDQLDFSGKRRPIIQCAEYNEYIPAPYVGIDNRQGGYLATRYLLGKGRRRIAFVGTQDHLRYSRDRRKGYLSALGEAGLEEQAIMVNSTLNFDGGHDAAKRLMEREDPPDALFFVSDMMAVGAINYLNSSGYKVPEDVAVMGFDNIQMSRMVLPHLTTVAQPMCAMGRQAAKMLFQIMKGDGEEQCHNVIFQPEIVERDSV